MGDHEAGEPGPPWAKQWEWGPLEQQLRKKSSVRRDKTLILNITFLAKSQGDHALGGKEWLEGSQVDFWGAGYVLVLGPGTGCTGVFSL